MEQTRLQRTAAEERRPGSVSKPYKGSTHLSATLYRIREGRRWVRKAVCTWKHPTVTHPTGALLSFGRHADETEVQDLEQSIQTQ